MNILVINGSPKGKRSNTYRLTSAFVEGMKLAQNNSPEICELDLSRLDIKPCLGCFSCWNKTPGKCCIDDDMGKVIERLIWADVTVWSFPLYYFNVPGKLKTLIDRQLPMTLPFMSSDDNNEGSGGHPSRYDMSGKRTVLVSTCGFYTAEKNYDSVISMFDRFCGKDNYTALFCGQGELFRVQELSQRTDEYLGYVKNAGKEYANGAISEGTQAKLNELLYPRDVFENMADASWGVDRQTGEKEDESLIFTRQMAALYRKQAYSGKDIVLDMHYTDIGKKYRIILSKDKSYVTEDFSGDYTTLIETPFDVWRSIAAGEIEGADALMKQMYKVRGDFNLMLKWDEYFGAEQSAESRQTGENPKKQIHIPTKNTSMYIMLIPWLVFWIAASVDSFFGSLISLAACVLVPLLFFQNKKTVYDAISGVAVGGFSIAVLAGAPTVFAVPLSYLAFGIMWSVSCFLKIPLTAHYSMNGYNGEAALENPLFVKTNRILTAAWGILYLLTPIWTYFIMLTDISSLVGAINSILPILMGVFTAWFQKWYPKKVARGE